MRKHAAALIGTAALIGAAVPALVAAPASASTLSCRPAAHRYVVTATKAAVHKTPSARGTVIGHVYKGQQVVSKYECNNGGTLWECIKDCQVSDNGTPTVWGHWVYRGYLRG
ncbi:hypothetical protein [Streptomyces sp. NPDC002676]